MILSISVGTRLSPDARASSYVFFLTNNLNASSSFLLAFISFSLTLSPNCSSSWTGSTSSGIGTVSTAVETGSIKSVTTSDFATGSDQALGALGLALRFVTISFPSASIGAKPYPARVLLRIFNSSGVYKAMAYPFNKFRPVSCEYNAVNHFDASAAPFGSFIELNSVAVCDIIS